MRQCNPIQHNQVILKAPLHCAFFRAASLATHCETSWTTNFTSVYTWQRARITAQRSETLLEIVTKVEVFYFPQWFLQPVSQHFRPLQVISHCAMFRATCLATFSAVARYLTLCNVSRDLSRNVFGRCKVSHTVQCFVRLVSQRFRPLQGISHCAM